MVERKKEKYLIPHSPLVRGLREWTIEMLEALIITLREGVEAALVIAIVLTYLHRTNQTALKSSVYAGLVSAGVLSLLSASWISRLAQGEELFEGVMMLVGAFFVTTMVFWMQRTGHQLRGRIEERVAQTLRAGRGAWLGLFLFTSLMLLREGVETALFLTAISFNTESLARLTGALLGLVLAVLLGVFLVRGTVRIVLKTFFRATTIALWALVLQLLAGGFHELSELGILPGGPTEMAIVGPIVRNQAIFLSIILALPLWLLLTPNREQLSAINELRGASRRLALAQFRKEQFWRRLGSAFGFAVILLLIATHAYSGTPEGPQPIPIQPEGDKVLIPLKEIQDGKMHKYKITLKGVSLRFFAIEAVKNKPVTCLDACLMCGVQGYGERGGTVICKNCTAEIYGPTIGKPGGCNPIPLRSRVEGDRIAIELKDLEAELPRFGGQ